MRLPTPPVVYLFLVEGVRDVYERGHRVLVKSFFGEKTCSGRGAGRGEGLPQVSLGFVWVDLWLVGASRATAWSNDSSGRVASIAGVGRVMAGVGRLASAVEGFASAPPQVASARLTSQ